MVKKAYCDWTRYQGQLPVKCAHFSLVLKKVMHILHEHSLFAAFSMHSTLVKFVQEQFLGSTSYHVYVMYAFLSAFLISGSVLAWKLLKKQQACRWRDLISGLVLGCSNYGAIYFLKRALSVPGWQSSQLFPTVCISVLSLSSLGAWAFFKERLHRRMLGALAIGVGSIVLINL